MFRAFIEGLPNKERLIIRHGRWGRQNLCSFTGLPPTLQRVKVTKPANLRWIDRTDKTGMCPLQVAHPH